MNLSKLSGIGMQIMTNDRKVNSLESFYTLEAKANNGELVKFEKFRGKKILVVNLASQCGFTPQYNELEQLYRDQHNNIVVLGFPSNDFGKQEPGNDEDIENFCKINFGVTFPLFPKDHVMGENKQLVYKWLTDPAKNGWNDREPSWNFNKYLIDENGNLDKMFSSSVSPIEIIKNPAVK